jgi:hypothetical protein
MPMNAQCCMNAQDIIVKGIIQSLKKLDLRSRTTLIKELVKIHPAFIDLLDHQLHEPPNPE